jgi:hypothetical protein
MTMAADLNVQKIASVFGVEETELETGRMKRREQGRKAFLAGALTDDALQRVKDGEATLDEVLLFGDGMPERYVECPATMTSPKPNYGLPPNLRCSAECAVIVSAPVLDIRCPHGHRFTASEQDIQTR